MRIEIRFIAEPKDDGQGITQLAGKTMTMEDVDSLHISSSIDIAPGEAPGVKYPMDTGEVKLTAHGLRAMWSLW